MQAPVEICYAGVVIARGEEVREGERGEFFVVMKEPLPVGTLLGLRSADSQVSVRVLRVVESADAANSGMQVRPAGSDEAGAVMWIPPPSAGKPGSMPVAVATPVTAAVATPAAEDRAPVQATPAEAAGVPPVEESAAEPVAPAEWAVDAAPVGEAEAPTSAGTIAAEAAAPAESNDSAAVPQAVPVTVGSSLTGALEGVVAGEPEASSGVIETSGQVSAPANEAPSIEGDLPPARPVQGSGGRRRTKRRR
jgi:hypothetical protein